jgi:hypothetical protein
MEIPDSTLRTAGFTVPLKETLAPPPMLMLCELEFPVGLCEPPPQPTATIAKTEKQQPFRKCK